LFRWWDRLEGCEVHRRRFGAAMGRLRREVEAALRDGTRCGCGMTSGSCAEILRVEESLWTFAGVAPTNNAAERAMRRSGGGSAGGRTASAGAGSSSGC
jgi:transposase